MARYISADDLTKKIFPLGIIENGNYSVNAKAVKVAIESTPTADVVEVVRCKDCIHYRKKEDSLVYDDDTCDILYYCDGSHRTACEQDFCSYGKRKEG